MADVSALRVLRVQAEMDASAYQAGAAGKVAADDAMVASGKRVGEAVSQTDTKISTSENTVTRLSRRYLEGFAAQESFGRGLAQIDRGLATGRIGMDQASLLIAGMTQRLGQHANASEIAARGQTQLASAVALANTRLEEQVTAANRSRAANQNVIQAANQNVGVASSGNGFNTANVAAQFQDIAVTSAMGMSPLQIALQQGTQLSAVLGNQGAAGAARTLGAALLSVISPVSLLTIGAVAGTAAFIQWMSKSRDGFETMDKAASRHRETLEAMKGSYAGLKIEAQSLADIGGTELLTAVGRQNKALNDALMRQQGNEMLSELGSNVGSSVRLEKLTKLDSGLSGYQPAWTKLLESVRQGRADFDGFDQSVNVATRSILAAANASGDIGAGAMAGYGENIKDLGRQLFDVSGKFAPFSDQIGRLSLGIAEGNPNLAQFNDEVAAIGRQPGLAKLADEAILLGKELAKVVGFTRELDQAQGQIMGMGRGESSSRQEEYNRKNREAAFYMGHQFDAEFSSIGARSPADLAAAARRREEARPVDPANENYEVRNLRIEQASKMALAQAENQLKQAQDDRLRSLSATVDTQREETGLIGQTTASAAQLRMQYDLTARLREEAARNGVTADQNEIEAIRQKSAEYGRLVAQQEALSTIQSQRDQIDVARVELQTVNLIGPARERLMDAAKAELDIRKMGIDLYGQEAAAIRNNAALLSDYRDAQRLGELGNDLQFERDQLSRSPMEQTVASRMQGAGLDVDLTSATAAAIRMNETLKEQRKIWDDIQSAGMDAIDSIFDGGQRGAAGFKEALVDVASDLLKTFETLAIRNPLKNAIYGAELPTLDQIGGVGGMLSALMGGKAPVAEKVGDLLGGRGATPANPLYVSMVAGGLPNFAGSNDNNPVGTAISAASPTSVNGHSMSGSVAEQAWSFFKSKGLSDYGAAAMIGQAQAESGFNPKAIGDSGAAFGLFQHHAARGGGQALLNSGVQGQLEHAWKELQTSERGVLSKLQSANSSREAARAAIGFERPQGWSAANPEGGHNFTGRLAATEQALSRFGGKATVATTAIDKMTTGATSATDGLGTLGSGFDQFGKNLANAFPAAPQSSGGGLGGFLGKLFGGGASFASMSAISPLAANYIAGAGGAIKGIFADGGWTGFGGKYDPAGIVHRGEYVIDQESVRLAGGPAVFDDMRRKLRTGYADGGFVGRAPYPMPSPVSGRASAGGVNIKFVNQSGVPLEEADTRQTLDENGNMQMEVTLRRMAADELTTPGRQGNMALQRGYGLGQKVVRR